MNYLVLSTVEVCDTLSRQLAYVNLPQWIDTEGFRFEFNKTLTTPRPTVLKQLAKHHS